MGKRGRNSGTELEGRERDDGARGCAGPDVVHVSSYLLVGVHAE